MTLRDEIGPLLRKRGWRDQQDDGYIPDYVPTLGCGPFWSRPGEPGVYAYTITQAIDIVNVHEESRAV